MTTFHLEKRFVVVVFFACLVAFHCFAPTPLVADVVYLRDGGVLYGRLISETDSSIFFSVRQSELKKYAEREIDRSEIATIVVNLDSQQLATLTPERPESYRLMAEELSTQKLDPEAIDLAIRLYLLGARFSEPETQRGLREGCFAGLVAMARNEREAKRFRALAYIHSADDRWLQPIAGPNENLDLTQFDDWKQMRDSVRDALRQLRRGDRLGAAKTINDPRTKAFLVPLKYVCSWQDLKRWTAESDLSVSALAKILELELALTLPDRIPGLTDRRSTDWSVLANLSESHAHDAPVSFANATEFDPDRAYFRNGQWTSDKR